MMKHFLIILATTCIVECYRIDFRSSEPALPKRNGSPLILTPYIQNGSILAGREASKVHSLHGIHSYSGFFTVNSSSVGNLFFWYFPAEVAPENASVVVWLQGGPGMTSMWSLFFEHGPLQLKGSHVSKRVTSWSQNIHMIYIDSPVGTGFSFGFHNGYSTSEYQVRTNLHKCLVQFFQLFPELSKNDFFIAGNGYAGKYVPFLADKIHKENSKAEVKINLKGMAIGGGVVDPMPPTPMEYENTYKAIWDDYKALHKYLNREDVQRQIHVNGMNFIVENWDVAEVIQGDWNTPVTPWVEELLDLYPILYYNGKLDPITDCEATQKFAEKLNWSGSQKFRSAAMAEWVVDGNVAGNVKAGGNLTLLQVDKSGHSVSRDQPKLAFQMINKFVKNEPLV